MARVPELSISVPAMASGVTSASQSAFVSGITIFLNDQWNGAGAFCTCSAAHCRLIPGLSLSDDVRVAAAVFADGSVELFAFGTELHPNAEPSSSANAAIPTVRSRLCLVAFTLHSVICAPPGPRCEQVTNSEPSRGRFRETHIALESRGGHSRNESF